MEDDGETYITSEREDDTLSVVEFGAVNFWEDEVTNEISELSSGSLGGIE